MLLGHQRSGVADRVVRGKCHRIAGHEVVNLRRPVIDISRHDLQKHISLSDDADHPPGLVDEHTADVPPLDFIDHAPYRRTGLYGYWRGQWQRADAIC